MCNSRGPRLPQRFSPDPRWDARIYPESLAVDCVLMATGSNYSLRSSMLELGTWVIVLTIVVLLIILGAIALWDAFR